MINCPYCGKLTDPKLENCPHCGGYVQKGSVAFATGRPANTGQQACPNCKALVKEGDIICVACGTNLLTGQKIAEEQKIRETASAGGGRRLVLWAGVAVVLVLVCGGLLYVGYALTRDPVQQAVQLAIAGNPLEASDVLNKHIQAHPEDGKAQFTLGKILWSMNQMPAAAAAFESAAKNDPTNEEAHMLAVLGLGMGGGQDSRGRQIALLKGMTAQSPNNAEAWFLLALMYGAENNVEQEMAALEKCAALDGSHRARGIALALKDDLEGAQAALTQAADQEGEGGDMAAALGFTACLAGKNEEAVQRLKQALDTDTYIKEEALTRLGLLLVAQGEFALAGDYLSRALEANAKNQSAQFYHAVCLQADGKTMEAQREFERIAQEAGTFATEATVRAAEMNLAQGNTQVARELVEKAVGAGGSSAALHTLRGRAMVLAGEDNPAREAFRQAIQTDANYAPAYLESGLLCVKQQAFTEGIQELEKYVSLCPADAPGTRVEEVNMLLDQLRQASGRAKAGDAATTTGRTM